MSTPGRDLGAAAGPSHKSPQRNPAPAPSPSLQSPHYGHHQPLHDVHVPHSPASSSYELLGDQLSPTGIGLQREFIQLRVPTPRSDGEAKRSLGERWWVTGWASTLKSDWICCRAPSGETREKWRYGFDIYRLKSLLSSCSRKRARRRLRVREDWERAARAVKDEGRDASGEWSS